MGLAICHECGGQISDRAPACPHCGVERPATTQRVRNAAMAYRGIGALLTLF